MDTAGCRSKSLSIWIDGVGCRVWQQQRLFDTISIRCRGCWRGSSYLAATVNFGWIARDSQRHSHASAGPCLGFRLHLGTRVAAAALANAARPAARRGRVWR
jgi:hypothetical protein